MKQKSKTVGLYFGSFNPIHTGHLIVAQYMIENTDIDTLWFVVSRLNPLKTPSGLLEDEKRLELVRLATEDNPLAEPCDVEFSLPSPSYTVDTLAELEKRYPDTEFCLIMGQDNINTFHLWKDYRSILSFHRIFVYPRPHCESCELLSHPSVKLTSAPMIDISSTYIRRCLAENKSIRYLVADKVREKIERENYYKQ